MSDEIDSAGIAKASADLARHFMEVEGEQIVRDMGGHLGDQLYEVMKRNGMMMGSAAGVMGVLTIAAAQTLGQAWDFLARTLADDDHGQPAIEADAIEAVAILHLFRAELPEPLRRALQIDPSAPAP